MIKVRRIILLLALLVFIPAKVKANSIVESNQRIILEESSYRPQTYDLYNIDGQNYISIKDFARNILSINSIYIEYDKDKDLILFKNGLYELSDYKRADVFKSYHYDKKDLADLKTLEKDINVTKDGGKNIVKISGYNINGINYIKIRDLAEFLDFSLYYDYVKSNLLIDLKSPYKFESREDFIKNHKEEYFKLNNFIMPLIKDPIIFANLIADGDQDVLSKNYYRQRLVNLRDDFTIEIYNKDHKLVDYNYYPKIYEEMENAASASNEIIYNLDLMKEGRKKPPYLDDYIKELAASLEAMQKDLNRYSNFYKN